MQQGHDELLIQTSCTVVMEIPQNYPTFTLSDPLKMGQFNDPCKTFISWSVAWLGEKHVDENFSEWI